MAGKRKRDGLSIQPGKGYKVCVGQHVGKNGALKPRTFYLGWDAKQAETLKLQIRLLWKKVELRAHDGLKPVWSEDDLREVECLKAGLTPDAILRGEKSIMLYDALEKYKDYVRQRYEAGQIRHERMVVCLEKVSIFKRFMADVPMKTMGFDELMNLTGRIASRPVGMHGAKISPDYAAHLLREAKLFFQWADAAELWQPPRRFYNASELLRVNPASITTEAEREARAARKIHFTLEELIQIWKALPRWYKMLVALSLNCGFGPAEIGSLRHSQLHLDAPEPYISRLRGKTSQPSCWVLWPETVELIKEFMLPQDHSSGLVFEAPYGGLMGNGKASRITSQYYQMRRRYNLQPPLPFKHYRKTSSQMIRDIAGVMAAEMQLSHAAGTRFRDELELGFQAIPEDKTAASYHGPGYQQLHEAIRRLRAKLQPMFDGDKPQLRLVG